MRSSIKIAIGLAALALALPGLPAGAAGPEDRVYPWVDEVRAVEEEGRRIANYLVALALAREEFARQAPAGTVSDRDVIVVRRDGWHVLFVTNPDLTTLQEKPTLIAEVVFDPRLGQIRKFRQARNPSEVPLLGWEHLLAVEAAIGSAAAHEEAVPPFEAVVFFELGAVFHIYLLGMAESGVVRFGGDLRVTLARHPVHVTDIELLHATAWPVEIPPEEFKEGTVHSHLEGDLPTPTDVALVLTHPTLAPHLVVTPGHIFRIDADGTIGYLGANEPAEGQEGESG